MIEVINADIGPRKPNGPNLGRFGSLNAIGIVLDGDNIPRVTREFFQNVIKNV